MATTREYIERRLAELNRENNVPQPSMSYWKALRAASRSVAARPQQPKGEGE
jgi:hypothetical protein